VDSIRTVLSGLALEGGDLECEYRGCAQCPYIIACIQVIVAL
jgi:hypothetical protein